MSIHDEFKARLERDVARFMNHATQSGMDVSELDGRVVLAIQDGKLINVSILDAHYQNKPSEVVTYGMVDGQPVGGYEPAEDAKAAQEMPAVLQVGKQKFTRMKRTDD